MAHPARPSESRKAQHHPAVVVLAVVVVVVVTVETIVVVVCCTLIPPAFQQTQSPTFTNGGGSCRWHGSFSIGWLGARHFSNFLADVISSFEQTTTECRNKLLGQMKQPKQKRNADALKDDANGTKARCQLTANRFPAIGWAFICSRWMCCSVGLASSPLTHPWAHAHTFYIQQQQPGCHPSFFTWTLRCFMAFPFTHTHTHTHRGHNSMNPSHSPLLDSRHLYRKWTPQKGKELFIFWQSQEIKSTFPAWIDKK